MTAKSKYAWIDPASIDTNDLLSVAAVCGYLGQTPKAIYALHDNGHMPKAMRIGRRLYWHPDEIRAWSEMRSPNRATWHQMRLTRRDLRERAKAEGWPLLPEEAKA